MTVRDNDDEGRVKESEHRAEQAGDLAEKLGLADLRARRDCTQAQIANAIGTSQSGVSRLERQHDILISTLRDYVAATGGILHLVARYPTYECEVKLPVLEERLLPPRSFQVIWQNVHTRRFVHVGSLRFTGSEFVFDYTPEAELNPDFEPFPAFPNFRGTYRSGDLFPFFADRIAAAARPNALLAALGLNRKEATPVELLARSWGATPHDTIQVVPDPIERPDGSEILPFLVSGVRHVDEGNPEDVSLRVARLSAGDQLELRAEPDNPRTNRAFILESAGEPVGWIPNYLLDYVHKKREDGKRVSVTVAHANGPETPWHLRLLCCLEVAPTIQAPDPHSS